jgi:TrmH family RNA methyltransferase
MDSTGTGSVSGPGRYSDPKPHRSFRCVPNPETWRPEEDLPNGCSLLVPFQDPENVGAIIRTAVAFDVNRIILLAESANPFHPKAVRASAGTVFSARLFHGPSLAEIPQDMPVVVPGRFRANLWPKPSFPPTFCLLTGMEGPGCPPIGRPRPWPFPWPPVESLNAAVATAIALYEWRRSL